MSARIVAEAAAVAKHPVAGNDDGEGIARAGLADGARTGLNRPRDLAVACSLAMGNGDDGGAKHFAERACGGRERQEIGRAHVWTPVTNAHSVCRLLLDKADTRPLLIMRSNIWASGNAVAGND